MHEYPAAPDWLVSQWFNTRSPLSLGRLLAEQAGFIGDGMEEPNQALPVDACDTQACPFDTRRGKDPPG